jgi:hypothetical protein
MRSSVIPTLIAGLFALALASSATAAAAWLPIGAAQPAEPEILVRTDTPSLLELEVTIPGLLAEDRQTPEGFDTYLAIPGHGHTLPVGAPAIPEVRFIVEVPFGAEFAADAVASGTRTFTLGTGDLRSRLYPVQASVSKNEERFDLRRFQRDDAAYAQAGLMPQSLVRVQEMGELRGHRLLLVEVSPIAYDPVAGTLLCHERIDVRIGMAGADVATTQALGERYTAPPTDALLRRVAINHDTFLGGPRDLPTLPIGMLVITTDSFVSALEPFTDWKMLKGYRPTVVTTTTTGATKEQIKAYIQNAYDNWPIPPTWVLLVGDTNTIPTWTGTGSATETDLYYCTLSGTDYLPEIAIGRFPARTTTDVNTMVEKTVDMEKLILSHGTAFTNRAAWLAASDLSGFAEQTHEYCISTWFGPLGFENTRIYERLGGTTQNAIDALNLGIGLNIYSGHGSETSWSSIPFSQTNIRNLTNLDMYPLVCSHACLTGSFGDTECFGETWVITPNKGGLAFWGASNYSYWDEDDILQRRGWDDYFTDPNYDLGTFCHVGLFEVYTYYGGGGYSRYYFEMYNLLGDPSADIWVTPPNALTASHPEVVFIGQTELTVTVTSSGTPQSNALVCAYMEGQTYEVGYTDLLGQVTLQLNPAPLVPGTMFLTASKHDRTPYLGSIQVMPASGPLVIYDSSIVDDDGAGESLGNGDAGADAGETIELVVRLENVGVDPAVGVTATLSTIDPYVMITDNFESYGTIPAGGTVPCADDYNFHIAGSCPSGHAIAFHLDIQAADRPAWNADFNVLVEAPGLSITRVIIDDAAGGNGNGRADPGETFDYRVFVTNSGAEDAIEVSADLTPGTSMITANQGTAGAALIAPGAEVELTPPYNLTVSPTAPQPEVYTLWFGVTADWEYAVNLSRELPVGGFFDDVETGTGSWTHYVGTTGFVDQWHRSSRRNHTTGGGWSWHQGDTGTGNYANLCDGCLVSTPIALGTTTHLRFWHFMDAEVSGSYPGYCYDGARLELSVNGSVWQAIAPDGGYPYRIRTGGTPGPFPAETPVYSGTSTAWAQATFTVTGQTGMAQFRFRFGSDGATAREGWYIDDVEVSGTGGSGQGAEEWRPVALRTALMQNTPNPFRPSTLIAFELPSAQTVSLKVFDAQGRLVRTLAEGTRPEGLQRITWDGADGRGALQPSGIYYYRLQTQDGTWTRSMTLVQ